MKYPFFIICLFSLLSCNYNSEKLSNEILKNGNDVFNNQSSKNLTDSITPKKETTPVINIENTIVQPNLYLTMKDETNFEGEKQIKLKLILNNLMFILKKNHLEPFGPPVSWITKQSNLFVIEGGIPLERKLPVDEPCTMYKKTKRCKAAVAHFFGKRSLVSVTFDSLSTWVKENHKTAIGNPWVVYVDDPHVMKDPNFLQTDVYLEFK